MKSEICKDKIYTVKEGVNPQTIFDLQLEPSEQADDPEGVEDPLVEEDVREDHQAHQEVGHQEDHPEETTIEIGTTSKEITKDATLLGKSTAMSMISMEIEQKLTNSRMSSGSCAC